MNSTVKGILIGAGLIVSLILIVLAAQSAKMLVTRAEVDIVPTNVRTSEVTERSAKVAWESKKESVGIVLYSQNSADLPPAGEYKELEAGQYRFQQAFEVKPATSHLVSLTFLSSNTTYYFKILVGKKIFDDGGIPFSLTTQPQISPTPTPYDCNLNMFKAKFGTADSAYDCNQDGVVNTRDYLYCLQNNRCP